jgi:hypothetical protein
MTKVRERMFDPKHQKNTKENTGDHKTIKKGENTTAKETNI